MVHSPPQRRRTTSPRYPPHTLDISSTAVSPALSGISFARCERICSTFCRLLSLKSSSVSNPSRAIFTASSAKASIMAPISFCSIYSPENSSIHARLQLCILCRRVAPLLPRPHSNIEYQKSLPGVIYAQQIIWFKKIPIFPLDALGRFPARQQYVQRDHRDPRKI